MKMNDFKKVESILKKHKKELKDKFYVKNIAVFGSYIRGTQTEKSDIDILVEFDKPITLIQFIRLENHLSQLLGVKVDLVMKRSLKPYIRKQVLKEAFPL